MKILFYKLFVSKKKRFANTIAAVERDGVVLDIDANDEWFAALAHYKFDEIREADGVTTPRLMLVRRKDLRQVAYMRLVVNMEKLDILLGDFESRVENRGYGSILLRNLINLAQELGVKTITGNLSPVDGDHFDKLRHIYEKFGFEVRISEGKGTILLRIV